MTYDAYPTATRDDYDVLVLGAGHNGLVAAGYLARAGLRVLVLEQRHIVGGAVCSEELFPSHPGYLFSTCAAFCWLLSPLVVEQLELVEHGLELIKCEPDPLQLFADDVSFGVFEDVARTQASIARLDAEDARRLPEWLAFWRRAAELVRPFLTREPPTAAELHAHAAEIGESQLLERLKRSSIADVAGEFFRDPRIQGALAMVEDVGDPWTPGSAWPSVYYSTNEYVDVRHEMVRGGMGTLGNALARAAVAHGAEIELNAEVVEIPTRAGAGVEGVVLADGRSFSAPRVLSNLHPTTTLSMVAELRPELEARTAGFQQNAGSLKLHCLMRRPPDLSRYGSTDERDAASLRIQLSLEHYRDVYRAARAGEIAPEPIVGTFATQSLCDPTVTAGPLHTVSLWAIYAPGRLARGSWETRGEEAAEGLIDWVERFVPNFREDIVERVFYTPADLEARVGMLDGCIHHLDIVPGQFMDGRRHGASGYDGPVPGLHLCGAGTHPGGEVSGLPGHNAAQALLSALERA